MAHKSSHQVYLDAIERMEPDITAVDHAGAICSIAISLKRIADELSAIRMMAEMERRR